MDGGGIWRTAKDAGRQREKIEKIKSGRERSGGRGADVTLKLEAGLGPEAEAGGEPVSAVLARPGLFLIAALRFNSAVRNGQTV